VEILVLHPGALGDIILSLPAMKILRDRFRDAGITLAANTDFASTVASAYASRIRSLSTLPIHRLYTSEPLPVEEKKLWLSYDRILSWTGHACESFAAKLSTLHPAAIVATWKPGPGERRHVSRIFADTLNPWIPAPEFLPVAEIVVDPDDCRQADEWLHRQGWSEGIPLIALHPGAGSSLKRWPLRKFLDLARCLLPYGTLLVLEGPAEPGLGRALVAELSSGAILASLPLRLLAAVLRRAWIYIGNDSGIAHLAAAMTIRSVVLFGPTAPPHWAPAGDHVSVLWNNRGCLPCERADNRAALHSCLDNISVEEVLPQALKHLV
jgi:ADP-heptose:LPS heptosyltransferase